MTVDEAARRLDRSPSWFRALAKDEGIPIERRGRHPGVDWAEVEAFIARSRIHRVDETLLRQVEPEQPVGGIDLLEAVEARFGWSDHDVADALRSGTAPYPGTG